MDTLLEMGNLQGVKYDPTKPNSEGTKHDQGKLRWDLLPLKATQQVVMVLTFGAAKYAPYNWLKGIKFSRLYAASQRHLTSWWDSQDDDEETGLNHLAHAICCLLFLLTYQLLNMCSLDDRPANTFASMKNSFDKNADF